MDAAVQAFIEEWRGLPAFTAEAGFEPHVLAVERFITRALAVAQVPARVCNCETAHATWCSVNEARHD